jgi:hypothetical protein
VEIESVQEDDRSTSRDGKHDAGSRGAARRSIHVSDGDRAIAVVVPPTVSGEEAVSALGLSAPRGLIVLNGGTADLSPELQTNLRRTLASGLAPAAIEEGLTVVTGGTDAGIFALFGEALAGERTAPCVGVVPAGRVTWAGREWPGGRPPTGEKPVPLEPHHSHFLLVEGDEWGVETDAMLALSAALSAQAPSLAVLAGGGTGARREVVAHLRAKREVIVLGGTGRFAERLAAAIAGAGETSPETKEMVASGLLTILDEGSPPSALADLLRSRLAGRGTP